MANAMSLQAILELRDPKSWQQPTPMLLDDVPSPSRLIYELAVAQNQANALLSTLAGIYSDLLGSSLQNTGAEITELQVFTDVSSVKELRNLQDLRLSVATVAASLRILQENQEQAISDRINKP